MVTRSLLALAAIVVLANAAFGAAPNRQITSADPKTTKPPADSSGAFGAVVAAGAHHEPESTTVSLDALASAPAKYEGKTLARRVTLGATKPSSGAVGLGARDVETNARLGPDPESGFALVMSKELAAKLEAAKGGEAVVVFTVTKVPIPDKPSWLGVVSRIDLLGADGAVTKTISAAN